MKASRAGSGQSPRSEFREWLQSEIRRLEPLQDAPDHGDCCGFVIEIDAAETVERAARTAMRLGAGPLVPPYEGRRSVRDACSILGQLWKWCDDQQPERQPERSRPSAELLNIGEVAAMLNVSARTVRRWDEDGAIAPSVKIRGRRLWNRETLVGWLSQNGNGRARRRDSRNQRKGE